ncbi:fused MFS/spermidine synthase [uncultured Sphingomonas sp.]|uniref:spermidine synthase n=1 Tax=uncultured Sphingomonas sp. TaxID=158754 RepID=UPI0025E3E3D1|nr:fused MFS/spermidine synthase [uncultured Sphingomonas sp.]
MTTARAAARRGWFVAAILGGSFLLFLVQPMVARMALPRLGGAPAVWNSAMLVYQALLLVGYGYAHWLSRFRVRTQAALHLGLLALAALWLPFGLGTMQVPPGAQPALWVPWLLVTAIGPLFLAISAQAPLLQRWYAVASGGRDPYALYAASNIGSFAGLLAYPLLVEPLLRLRSQSWLWTAGYAVVALLVLACASRLPRGDAPPTQASATDVPILRDWARWIVLALVPSGLMLATTTFLTTDIVAVPLLWVLPLGLYLLSFPLAFRTSALLDDLLERCVPLVLLLFGATLVAGDQRLAYVNALIGLVLLFAVSVACHARLYALRPAPERLTGFYLAMAVGGALGGVFAGLVAPVLFDWTYEYPLLILAAGLLIPQRALAEPFAQLWASRWRVPAGLVSGTAVVVIVAAGVNEHLLGAMHVQLAFVAVAAIGLVAIGARWPFAVALVGGLFLLGGYNAIQTSLSGARTRSYFGVYTVSDKPHERRLAHGTTLHGVELKGARATHPTTYYQAGSGVGQAMQAAPLLYGAGARIGVVGLGTGTLACYARPGQHWRFFEIDPAVVHLARDSGAFGFLRLCAPQAAIVVGDARLRLGELPPASLDLLALDAFSSDAVPMHLMTAEAFAAYGRVLAPDGLLLVHISNRFLALGPVVAGAAKAGGWQGLRLIHTPTAAERRDEGTVSDWIALSRSSRVLSTLQARSREWRQLVAEPGFDGWTDDHASLVPVLRLFRSDGE